MLQRVLFLLLLPTLTLTAQPLVGPDAELWPLVEIKEPGDTSFQVKAGPARRGIQRGVPTLLRFVLPSGRKDTFFLVFSNSISQAELSNARGDTVRTGNNLWPGERSLPLSDRVLPVPPEWEGPLLLRIQDIYLNERSEQSRSFGLRFYHNGFAEYFAKELDPHRPRAYRRANNIFLLIFGFILFLVALAWAATRRAIFGAYLLYNGWVWSYYFIRKTGSINWLWLDLPSSLHYFYEAVASVLILPAYLFFLRRFLRLTDTPPDRKISRQIKHMTLGSLLAAFLVFLGCSLSGVYWGYWLSIYANCFLLAWGVLLLRRVHQRGDHFSGVILWAAITLVAGIAIVYTFFVLGYLVEGFPDPSVGGLGIFQYAVLAETAILFYGIAVWAGRRADDLGAAAGAGEVGEAVPPPVPGTLTIRNKVIPTLDL